MFRNLRFTGIRGLFVLAMAAAAAACGGGDSPESQMTVIPVYNELTGRLERLTTDSNNDGKMDTWAFMDGPVLKYIEIDRDADGRADRWEYYEPQPSQNPSDVVIIRAEERAAPGQPITRQEFFENGVLVRVEEDTNGDGRVNRWEQHVGGRLVRMDLDLKGRGTPDRRLIYEPGGSIRVEVDPDGDGVFEAAAASKPQ